MHSNLLRKAILFLFVSLPAKFYVALVEVVAGKREEGEGEGEVNEEGNGEDEVLDNDEDPFIARLSEINSEESLEVGLEEGEEDEDDVRAVELN